MVQKSNMKILSLSILVIALLLSAVPLGTTQQTTAATSASTQTTANQKPNYCAALTNTTTAGGVLSTNNNSALTNILSVSMIIMIMMLAVVGILYSLGYAFRYDKLIRFSKAEIGEVFITVLIIFVFLGSISGVNSLTGSSKVFALSNGAFNSNMFTTDCSYLANTTAMMYQDLGVITIDQILITAFSHLTITIGPINIGKPPSIISATFQLALRPFQGYEVIGGDVSMLSGFYAGFGLLLTLSIFIVSMIFSFMGTMIFLGFVFALFPLFLYVGILLRTLPWTRPAGGAFLGVFIGFYLFFPTILYLFLSLNPISSTLTIVPICSGAGSSCSMSGGFFSAISALFSSIGKITSIFACAVGSSVVGGSCLFTNLIQNVVAPAVYTIFALLISFLLAFDFASAVAKLLGAPSLQAKHVLRNLL
jgi:hypothetical protein